MKRSESRSYIEYAASKAAKNYMKSLLHYLKFIDENGGEFSIVERAEALQRMAELLYHLRSFGIANVLHQVALDSQPGSLRVKMEHARFLCRQANDYVRAGEICDQVIDEVERRSMDEACEAESLQLQRRFAEELKIEIEAAKGRG